MNRSTVRRALAACALGAALGACGGGSDAPEESAARDAADNGDTVLDTSLIAEELRADALEDIVYDDGSVPITDGSWVRFPPRVSWNYQLQGPLNTSYEADLYIIDMFSTLGRDTMATLKEAGRTVFCYFSAGTHEPWRPDLHLFDEADLSSPHLGFPEERWLDPTSDRVIRAMINRMDMAVKIGCDGVELDNVDGYEHRTGLEITPEQQIRYIRVLANAAHARNLAVSLKNAPRLLPEVVPWFDLSLNESCFRFDECHKYAPMIQAGKPVLNAEYGKWLENDPVAREEQCARARGFGLSALVLRPALDGAYRHSCDGT